MLVLCPGTALSRRQTDVYTQFPFVCLQWESLFKFYNLVPETATVISVNVFAINTCQLNDTIRTEIHIRQMLNKILQYGQQNVGFKFVVNDENSLLHFASVALSHIKGSNDSEKNTIQIVPLEYCWSGHCPRNLFPSLVPETTTVIVVDVFAVYTWQLNDDIRTERYNRQMCNQIFQYGHQSIAFKFVGNDENNLLHFASIALSHIEGSDDEYETNSIVPLECCWSGYSC